MIPDAWLEAIPGEAALATAALRYVDFFVRRLAAAHLFEQEAVRARS